MRMLFDSDELVAQWMFAKSRSRPMQFNLAIGLIDEETDAIVGGVMWTGWNGSDAEVHYYGPKHLNRRVVRTIMQISARVLGLNRLTLRTRKPAMARGVAKLGAVYEGKIRRLYGPTDDDIHAGHQFAFFRETILKLAKMEEPANVRQHA
jgi:RimJ/RimL family protein N-acetyltransferase